MQLEVLSNFFGGFFWAAFFPTVVGVFVGIKRAMWASAFGD